MSTCLQCSWKNQSWTIMPNLCKKNLFTLLLLVQDFSRIFIGFLMAWFRYTSIYEFSEKYKLRIGNLPWKLSVFFTDMKVLLCMKSNSEWSVYLRSRSSTWMGSEMIWSAVIMVISGLVRFIASLANGDILKPYTSDQKSTEDFLNLNDHSMIHLRNT